MKKTIIVLVAIGVIVTLAAVLLHKPTNASKDFQIAVISIVEIEPIAELRKGFRQEFEASKFAKERKVVFTEYNAQGDSGVVNQIADKVTAEKPDLVYALGTPVAQAVQKRAPELLIVQGAVTDPVAAGLAKSWNGSGKKYVATSDLPPIAKQVALIRELAPTVKRIGVLFNPGEANSVAVIKRLRDEVKKFPNLSIVERPIGNSSEVAAALESLLGNIDAIYIPPDNTAHAAIPIIGRFATENKLPMFATVSSALADGAVATLALDFAQLGRNSAKLAIQALTSGNPGSIPIELNSDPQITINAKIGIALKLDVNAFRNRANVKLTE